MQLIRNLLASPASVVKNPSFRRAGKNAMTSFVQSPLTRGYYCGKLNKMLEKSSQRCLHLGCGPRHFDGWINIDLVPTSPMPDVLLDLSLPLPIPDRSVDYIFSETFTDCLTHGQSAALFRECARVLRPGGVFRISCADLGSIVRAYLNKSQRDLTWYQENFGCTSFAEMLNMAFVCGGNVFLYDEEAFVNELSNCGFEVVRNGSNASEHAIFRGLELRNPVEDGSHSMFFDCRIS